MKLSNLEVVVFDFLRINMDSSHSPLDIAMGIGGKAKKVEAACGSLVNKGAAERVGKYFKYKKLAW